MIRQIYLIYIYPADGLVKVKMPEITTPDIVADMPECLTLPRYHIVRTTVLRFLYILHVS